MYIANICAANFTANKYNNAKTNNNEVEPNKNTTNDRQKLELALEALATINKVTEDAINNINSTSNDIDNNTNTPNNTEIEEVTSEENNEFSEVQNKVTNCYKKIEEVKKQAENEYQKELKLADKAAEISQYNLQYIIAHNIGDTVTFGRKQYKLISIKEGYGTNAVVLKDLNGVKYMYDCYPYYTGSVRAKKEDDNYIVEVNKNNAILYLHDKESHNPNAKIQFKMITSDDGNDVTYEFYDNYCSKKWKYCKENPMTNEKIEMIMKKENDKIDYYKDNEISIQTDKYYGHVKYKGKEYILDTETGKIISYFTPISTLNLSARAENCLSRAGITSIEALSKMSSDDIWVLRGMGKTSLDEIKTKLDKLDIHLQ